ncbi:hypothetical protein [Rhizobium tumorigenes]|uniref:hypothetical protein n=1 Tax=Rhizobium tumorigenes TaxID=2041385 RepID=UPI00241D6078|nr:hypothetical protein [Rhizobium tumorigenes]WFS02776.1 hypothetical protein PR016_09315 [Rhizobium tumorigenes]
MSDDMFAQFIELEHRIAEIERRGRNRKRQGTITEVEAGNTGRYRVKLSEPGGKPYLTGWLKTRQMGAGGVKIDVLLNVGEQVDVVSDNGDLTDAQIDLSTYSDANPRANTTSPLHIKIGDSVLTMSGDGHTITSKNHTVSSTNTTITASSGHLN